ncbi:LacI family transcriptional regulator [Vibrio sp.]|uniref:LacI family transcriptional regulator n=1 Tax=Vibrio viridaestus TaxID=2487322 RepID=A0A3N9U8K5_9VIBR|nr:LacI family DNA-binding transcriptional regulator [Vibrio viridaestus]MDC0611756.1 LacI family transcriptional regulator [Vibrio sp.]RQW64536.1 LacI family transcriptional regulator [Vibrio viridaestus]
MSDDITIKKSKATAKDVALRAGVSKWTVNRAFTKGASISKSTMEKVLKASEELGYRPNLLARSLSKKRTNIVGIVVDQLKNPNIAPVLDEITTQLQNNGFMALLLNISNKHSYESVLRLADQFQVDGLLYSGTVLSDELISLARDKHNIALVQMFRNSLNPDIQVVTSNGYAGGQEVAHLLFNQGYQRFGYLKGPDTDTRELLRLDGYRDYLNAQKIEVDTVIVAGQYEYHRAYDEMVRYLNNTSTDLLIDALFCENDILALGAIDALRDHPSHHHIGIVGYDDMNLSDVTAYQLTTYSQPRADIISRSIKRLLKPDLENNKELLRGKLVRRKSHLKP